MFTKETPRHPARPALPWLGLALLVAAGGCMLTGSESALTAGPDGLAAGTFELQCYPDTVTAPGGTTAVVPIVLSVVDVPAAAAGSPGLRHGGDGNSDGDDGSSSDDDSSSDDSSSDDGVDCSRVCHCDITALSSMEAFLLDVEFDQTYLTYNSTLSSGTTAGWVFLDGNLLSPGVVRLGGFTTPIAAIANPDTLGYVVFDVAPGAHGHSFLETMNFQDDLEGLPNAVGCIKH